MTPALALDIAHRIGAFELRARAAIPPRGLTALFGPSGCGKTTLLRCIAGLIRARRAHVEAFGAIWQDEKTGRFVKPHKRPCGLVFQDAALFSHLDVKENLAYGLRRTRIDKRRFDVAEVCAIMEIEPLLDRPACSLSGGERQRTAIARSLLASPRLLLMDEPLSSLDESGKSRILPFLERIRDELAMPIVYVSHSIQEVSRLADHLLLLHNGRITASGPANELLTRLDMPMSRHARAGATLRAVVTGHDSQWHLTELACAGATLFTPRQNLAVGERLRLHIPAREVSLSLTPDVRTSNLNRIAATVEACEAGGPGYCTVRLRVRDERLLARITQRSRHELHLTPGKTVFACIKAVSCISIAAASHDLTARHTALAE